MTQRYDLVIAGGGPSGSAAAWQAAQTGAKVVVLDKAQFPRAKPCGDGLTARATSYLQKMGLADEVATFHRVNKVTVSANAQTVRNCHIREGDGGVLMNGDTNVPFTYKDPCVERDPHTNHDPAATEAAKTAVKDFYRTVFKLD